MSQAIDQRIKQAQKKGISVTLISGAITATIFIGFLVWLFFVKGFNLIIGPSDALTTAHVEVVDGLAWANESNIYTLGGEVKLRISSPTFQTADVMVNNQSPSTLNIMLLPSPATITASPISTDPAFQTYAQETQWFLNGTLVHIGASLSHSTVPGAYQLVVDNPYYELNTLDMDLARAQELDIQLALTQISGALNIDSLPQGVDVMINEQAIGKTPLQYSVNGGTHKVKLISDTFENIEENIALRRGYLFPSRNYQLVPKQGEVFINATPNDGVLLINNVEYALGRVKLDANRSHRVSYTKPGYSEFSKQINVNINQTEDLNIRLQAQRSEVLFTSNVPAMVAINGKPLGETPVSTTLLSVAHKAVFQAQGYRTKEIRFSANNNKPTSVKAALLTEFDARRAEGKPLFIQGLGIEMKRFRGNAFTMGSPPNETGRRRNEHQVPVDFSRQFLIASKEITRQQFAAFTQQKVASGNLPVTDISWVQAALYCNWLSEQEGLPVFYRFANGRYAGVNKDALGYRLPSEAEWEWVAKKSQRSVSTIYIWGNQDRLRANAGNFADEKRKSEQIIVLSDYQDKHTGLAPVGSYKADRNGLFDLAGNVSEWVHDKYTNSLPDTSTTHVDYLGSTSGDAWVIKGGSYETGRLRELRAAYREFSSTAKPTVGFRIARYYD